MDAMNSDDVGLINQTGYSIPQITLQSAKDFFIYAFQPCYRIRHIKIKPHYLISILNIIYPNDTILIYKGQVLERKNSFNYYKILNDDKIIVLPFELTKSSPELIDKWKKESLDIESFEQKLNLQINSNCRKEISRIRDLKTFKSELKRSKIGLNSNNYLNSLYDFKKKDDTKLNIDYPKSDFPSCEPLPISWE